MTNELYKALVLSFLARLCEGANNKEETMITLDTQLAIALRANHTGLDRMYIDQRCRTNGVRRPTTQLS